MKLPSREALERLQEVVRIRIGFDPQSLGSQSFQRTAYRRMAEMRISDGTHYITQLLADEAEFEAFVEELVVPETWFFRDREPFRCVQRYATRGGFSAGRDDRLRILSIPCSTGEEPYSIAMALFDVGLTPSQCRVDGADLSRRALQQAGEGVYGKSSFRGDEAAFPGLCDRFLERQADRFVVRAPLRETVRFFHANLISPTLPAMLEGGPRYHMVLCRNVLIYLDADARRAALNNLHQLVISGGLLYVGHVEARLAAAGAFRPFHADFPFAFTPSSSDRQPVGGPFPVPPAGSRRVARPAANRRVTATTPSPGTPPATTPTKWSQRRVVPGAAASGAGSDEEAGSAPSRARHPSSAKDIISALAAARAAANCGHLEEAVSLCEEVLKDDPANADALCLIGLAFKTRGQMIQAEEYFQRVLYLDPRHEESLVHLMLLAQQRGDDRSAANFRRRAQQVHRREDDR